MSFREEMNFPQSISPARKLWSMEFEGSCHYPDIIKSITINPGIFQMYMGNSLSRNS